MFIINSERILSNGYINFYTSISIIHFSIPLKNFSFLIAPLKTDRFPNKSIYIISSSYELISSFTLSFKKIQFK